MVANRRQDSKQPVEAPQEAGPEAEYEVLLEGTDDLPPVYLMNTEQSHAFFDRIAREELGISREEFLRRYDAGEYDAILDDPDRTGVMHLVALLPFGR
jgi:hypothetical protein